MIKTRIAILQTMHEFVINKFNDEENIMEWLTYGVPDCPDESDYEFIAEDELIEVTPKSIRLRKKILNTELRLKAEAKKKE